MSSSTTNLELLKMDPSTDGASTFNIDTMLNDNWDKIDTAVAGRETLLKDKSSKNTPVDADSVPVIESEGTVKKTTWAQVKTTLKTYFDTIYPSITHKSRHATGGADALIPSDIGALSESGDGKDVTVTFEVAAEKSDISSGDTLATILGKLVKWCKAFGAAAWMNTGTTAGTVALGNHTHNGTYEPVITALPVNKGGTGATTAAGARENLEAAQYVRLPDNTIPVAGWAGTAAPYTQSVAYAGILATDEPGLMPICGSDAEAAKLIKEAWAQIWAYPLDPYASDGYIHFYAQEKPSVAIPFYAEVIR